jgi:FkbM family methyltransferase
MGFLPAIKHWVHQKRFNWAAANGPTYRLYLKYIYEPKAGSVDAIIDQWSKETDAFTVLQVGANDGFTHDPVQKWAKRDQWRGVLLEPQPHVVAHYTRRMYAAHPDIHVINAALGEEDGTTKLYKISFSNDRWASGLSRFDKASLEQLIAEGRLDKRIRKNGAKPPKDRSQWIDAIDVPVISFDTLFQNYDFLQHTKLLMIDTEGFDGEVIRMFPFEQTVPPLVVFEDMHLSEAVLKKAHERLAHFGYRYQRSGPNTIAWQNALDAIVQGNLNTEV